MPITSYEDTATVQADWHIEFLAELTKPSKLSIAINSEEVTEILERMAKDE